MDFKVPNDAYVVVWDPNGLLQGKFYGKSGRQQVTDWVRRFHALEATE